jgi:hypothetical protein
VSGQEVHAALAVVNAQLTNPSKDGRGNYGQYLTLDNLLDHVRPTLAASGLSVVQDVTTHDDTVSVVTHLLHSSGESIAFGPLTGPTGPNWQTLGGAVTYARRYALLAALGVAGGDDDDAQHHTDTTPAEPFRRGNRTQAPPTAKQREYLDTLIANTGAALDPDAWDKSARTILGGLAEGWDGQLDTLDKTQASALIEALKGWKSTERKATRTKAHNQPDDPWATAPLVDPLTGEIVE